MCLQDILEIISPPIGISKGDAIELTHETTQVLNVHNQ